MPHTSLRLRLRPLLVGGFVAFASLLSCGREVTGPGSGPRPSHPIAFLTTLPGPLASVEAGAGSVIPFDRVRVILTRSDGSEAFAQTFPFGGNVDSIAISPVVTLLSEGDSETFALFLRYLNAQGDTVFAGGPVLVTAFTRSFRGERPPPAEVPLDYTGPGAGATSVTIAPDTIRVTAGEPFEFVTTARDGQGVEVPSPILHSSSDTARAVLPDARFGSGLTRPSRGTVTIRAVLPNGNAEALGVLEIAPAPASITRVGSEPLVAPAGTTLSDSVRVRLLATDGLPIAGATIDVAIDGGGSVNDTTLITDADGRAAVTWTLGSVVGTQSNTLRFTTPGWGTLLINAEGTAPQSTAVRAVIVTGSVPVQTSLIPVSPGLEVQVWDANDEPVAGYSGPLTLEAVQTPSGGALSGTLTLPVVQGIAIFDEWSADVAGTYVVRVTGPGIAPDTSGTIVFDPGVAANVSVVSGDNQTGLAGELIPAPIVLLVTDAAGNRVANWQVLASVIAGGGTITPTSQFTDTTGTVTFTQWTLGTAGTNTLRILVEGAGTLEVNASAEPPPPEIVMNVVGSNVVGVGRVGTIRVRLLQPAPAGGLTVTTVIDSTQYLSFVEVGTLGFAAGETEQLLEVNGLAAGTAVLRASAPGYITDTLVVPVSVNLISVPQTLNVPLAQRNALPISLSAPAPAGGVTVALTVDNPGIAQPVSDSVFIAAGTQSVNVDIEGLALGTVNVTASNPNYSPSGTSVTVTAGVNITAVSYAINQSFGLPVTVQLVSGVTQVGAPPGGITVGLSTDDATCASVPPSVTIGEGLTSATVNVVYGGSATAPCNTVLRALGPQGFSPDSATVTVATTPLANLPSTNIPLGSGLQRSVSIVLGANNHGGTTVRVTSPDTTRLVVAPDANTVGGAFVDIPVQIGITGLSFIAQAKEGFAAESLYVFSSAPGFITDSMLVRIYQPIHEVIGLSTTLTAGGSDDTFYARIGSPVSATGGLNSVDEIRAGGDSIRVSFVSDSAQVGTLVRDGVTADSLQLVIPPLGTSTPLSGAGSVAFRPLAGGTAVIRTVVPGLRPATGTGTSTVTVNAPSINALSTFNIGSGLERAGTVTISSAPADTLSMRLYFDRPGVALLSDAETTVGTDTLTLRFAPGNQNLTFYVQALEGRIADTLTLTAEAPGYIGRTSTIRVFQSAYEILNLAATATTLTTDDQFVVRVGTPTSPLSTAGISTYDEIRPGAPPLAVDIVNDTPGILTLVDSTGTRDSLRIAMLPAQSSTPTSVAAGGVAARFLAEGTATVRANILGLRPAAGTNNVRTVTISAPSISLPTSATVGAGLQRNITVSLSQAPTDTARVTVRFDSLGLALVSATDSTLGSDSLVLVYPPGLTSRVITIQALEGTIDQTIRLRATAPGFNADSMNTRILQPVFSVIGLNTTTTTLAPDDPFEVRVGTPSSPTSGVNTFDPLRIGSPGVTVRLSTSNSTIARLVTQSASGDSVTIPIFAGESFSPSDVANGGVALDLLTPGTVSITGAIDGFRNAATATATVTVNSPTITLNTTAPTVGAGLQTLQNGSLNTTTHGGITITLRSTNPNVLRLATSPSAVATDSITITVPNLSAGFSYYIAGVEGTTGTVNIEANAPGFVAGAVSKSVATPAIVLGGNLASTGTAGVTLDDPFTVSVGLPNGQLTALAQPQAVRAGATLQVTVASSDPAVGTIISPTAPSGAGSTTVNIVGGQNLSPGTVAAGGVAFRFLAPGSTTVSATAPGFVQVTGGQQLVTVSPP